VGFSVVILSKNINNLRTCVGAVRSNEPDAKIIVVDDGLEGVYAEYPTSGLIRYVAGEKPFIFARNANIGIRAAGDDDVILLNDDAILKTPDGFTKMEAVSKANPEYGVIAAVTDAAGNPNQTVRPYGDRKGLRDEPRMVCFLCVYIPRHTFNLPLKTEPYPGLLDERYVDYAVEDDDFCAAVREAGLKIGVYDLCYVDHSTLRSSFRSGQPADFKPNLKLFIEKWGVDNHGKKREESEWAALFPEVTV
jgi:GT2 family glycosyltransferase